ncbi:hypothetical protein [Botrimarina sp.]|uniref:hypothetical protein n=1 Tax=Botrimarina sp. TaxID=2795802 RepID=UPI0032F008F4
MPTPRPSAAASAAPLRVAECGDCGQLFALQAATGAVACPACGAATPVASLEVAELGVAEPVEISVPASEPSAGKRAGQSMLRDKAAKPEPPADHGAATEPADGSPSAAPTAPTVADWLLRNGEPDASEGRSPLEPSPLTNGDKTHADAASGTGQAAKPSLSEALGFDFGSFRLGEHRGAVANGAESAEAANPDASDKADRGPLAALPTVELEPYEAPPLDLQIGDFRFDPADDALDDDAPDDDAPDNDAPEEGDFRLEPVGSDADADGLDANRRRWGRPLAVAAGLLLLAGAGTAAYLFAPSSTGPDVAAGSRERRAALREEAAAAAEPADDRALLAISSEDSEDSGAAEAPEPLDASTADTRSQPADPFAAAGTLADTQGQPLPPDLPAEPGEFASNDPAPQAGSDLPAEPPTMADARSTLPKGLPTDPAVEPVSFEPDNTPKPISQQSVYQTPLGPDGLPPWGEPAAARIGLVGAPSHSVAELTEAVDRARPAGDAFAAGSLADKQQLPDMGRAYAELSQLAQVLTLLDPGAEGGSLTAELEATDVFRRLWRTESGRRQSQQVAGPWLAWTGRPNGGVLFAGTVVDINRVGELVQYDLQLDGEVVPVVMAEELDLHRFIVAGAATTREVGVIGVVIEEPRQWLAGYDGPERRVVWARKTIPLAPADAP